MARSINSETAPRSNGFSTSKKKRNPKTRRLREKFNAYRFADYKEKVIDLLMRVTTVSVTTANITREMGDTGR